MNTWMTGKDLMKSLTKLSNRDVFYSNWNIEAITNVDYRHAKRVYREFNNKNLGDYHDLYVQSDTLSLSDLLENFRNMYDIYESDPANFFSAPGLVWQAALKKKTGINLELLTDIDMLLIIGKGTRGGIYNTVHSYAKANNKYMKNYDKNRESSYIMYFNANNLYGWTMP